MDALETYNLGNKRLEIHSSEGFNPREDDNLSQLAIAGGMGLGRLDEVGFTFPRQYEDRFDFIERGEEDLRKGIKDIAVCLPIHVYQHGSIGLSTSMANYPFNCRWDSGTIGFVIVTKQAIRDNWTIKNVTQKYRDMAEKIAIAEVELLSQYLNGECYRYELFEDGEEVDACSGFLGSDWENNGLLDHIGNEWKEVLS